MKAMVCSTGESLARSLTRQDLQWIIDRSVEKNPKKPIPTHPEAQWLHPYCQGLTVDIGCGAEKVLPTVLGIDRLAFGERGQFGCMNGVASSGDVSADAGNLDFIQDGTLDSVVSRHCFEHLPDPVATVREWLRILKPSGHLALVLPNDHWCDFLNMDKDHKFRCYPEVVTDAVEKLNQENGKVKGKLIEVGRPVVAKWSFFALLERA
jgi:SAM-dependent methyltransferase